MADEFSATGDPFSIESPIVFDVPPSKNEFKQQDAYSLTTQKSFIMTCAGGAPLANNTRTIGRSIWISKFYCSWWYYYVSGTPEFLMSLELRSASGTLKRVIARKYSISQQQGYAGLPNPVHSDHIDVSFNPPLLITPDEAGDQIWCTAYFSATAFAIWNGFVLGYVDETIV